MSRSGDGSIYVVDANTWIKLYETTYQPELFPSLWSELGPLCDEGVLRTPPAVLHELNAKKPGGIGKWLRGRTAVETATPSVMARAAELSEQFKGLTAGAAGARSADPVVIALAEKNGWIVVTEELSRLQRAPHNMKIPDVCLELGVTCVRAVELLQRLQVRICKVCSEDAASSGPRKRVPRA